MILENLPEVQSLTAEEKSILTQELLDELNAPEIRAEQEGAILELLNARYELFRSDPATASSWEEARDRLREKTGASWRK